MYIKMNAAFSRMSALFEARATKERALVHAIAKVSIELIAIYFHCFEIFIIQIGEIAFCKPEFIIIKSNYVFSEWSKRRMLFGLF
jgi:hypothetical protein